MELTLDTILILAGLSGLAISILAIPISIALLRRQAKKIKDSIHAEYEL